MVATGVSVARAPPVQVANIEGGLLPGVEVTGRENGATGVKAGVQPARQLTAIVEEVVVVAGGVQVIVVPARGADTV